MKDSKLNTRYDVIIVGGGIVGAGIFRDLALHGVNTLIIDRYDFASQTSSKSSKMFHGGLRYLENYDFAVVMEALHEKNLWLKMAPHLCIEKPFYVPIFKDSKYKLWMLQLALFLYDLLSGFKNSKRSSVNSKGARKVFPELREEDLVGAGIYYDVLVDDAKVTLENIFDGALVTNGHCQNYKEFVDVDHKKRVAKIKDTLTGEINDVGFKKIVYCLGPFTDQFLGKREEYRWKSVLVPSRGAHLWLKGDALHLKSPMVMFNDDRVIFVLPQNNKILVGTTESPIEGDMFNLEATSEEVDYLIKNLYHYFPKAKQLEESIISSFAGVRPLVSRSQDLGKISRKHEIFFPHKDAYAIAGGKLTTFRTMGQRISRDICKGLNIKYDKNRTKVELTVRSVVDSFYNTMDLNEKKVEDILKSEYVRTFDDFKRRLALPDKYHWSCNDTTFEEFFKGIMPMMNRYIKVTETDIENF